MMITDKSINVNVIDNDLSVLPIISRTDGPVILELFSAGRYSNNTTLWNEVYVDGVDTAEALETAQDAIDSDLF